MCSMKILAAPVETCKEMISNRKQLVIFSKGSYFPNMFWEMQQVILHNNQKGNVLIIPHLGTQTSALSCSLYQVFI